MSDTTERRKQGNELPNTELEVLIKVRDVIKRLERDGWKLVGVKGDHRQFEHPNKPGKVTVPGHLGSDMPIC